MVDWNSPAELQLEGGVYLKVVHCMAGIFVWDFVTSLDFEWSFITRRNKFRWPLALYFLSRYVLLSTVIGMLIAQDITHEINCQALYSFVGFTVQASVGLPTLILAIRTMVLWSMKPWIVFPLIVLILGQWSLIIQGAIVKATYTPGAGCVLSSFRLPSTAASFFYAVFFDVVLLILSAWKLTCTRGSSTRLSHLMVKDGLLYYVLVLVASIPAAVFITLNLNSIMNVMFNVPAAVFSTIVCGHAVRRLSTFSGVERSQTLSRSRTRNFALISGASSGNTAVGSGQSNGKRLFGDKKSTNSSQKQLDTFLYMDEGGNSLSDLPLEHKAL